MSVSLSAAPHRLRQPCRDLRHGDQQQREQDQRLENGSGLSMISSGLGHLRWPADLILDHEGRKIT
jgi:hypothetical protein